MLFGEAMGKSGAGFIGDYKHCSFSVKGIGRFMPMENSHPAIGQTGKLEEVLEERIETICYKKDLNKIIKAIKAVHPYEQAAIDLYPLAISPHDIARK